MYKTQARQGRKTVSSTLGYTNTALLKAKLLEDSQHQVPIISKLAGPSLNCSCMSSAQPGLAPIPGARFKGSQTMPKCPSQGAVPCSGETVPSPPSVMGIPDSPSVASRILRTSLCITHFQSMARQPWSQVKHQLRGRPAGGGAQLGLVFQRS